MGKVLNSVSILVLLAGAVAVRWTSSAAAQTATNPACSGVSVPSPMLGHYTGPWQSNGDYQFTAHFPAVGSVPAAVRVLEMKIIIDGKLDVTIGSDGQVSGSATGNVDAPIYHDSGKDISSGIGTISGSISGTITARSSSLTLAHPRIDMHWGTFGGRAVETFPVMPDHSFSVSTMDCISSQGTSAEDGFPVMNITNDSTGQLAQAPGIGTSSGTWKLTSDHADQFRTLTGQVDDFTTKANGVLAQPALSLTSQEVKEQIVQPLQALEATINQEPAVARCLLERLLTWERTAVTSLLEKARSSVGDTIVSLRQATDLAKAAHIVNIDCDVSEANAPSVRDAEKQGMDRSLSARDWSAAMLWIREVLLAASPGQNGSITQQIAGDFARLVQQEAPATLLDSARVAYALGDTRDAGAVVALLPKLSRHASEASGPWHPVKGKPHKTKPKPPKATPTAIPAPRAPTLGKVLSRGVAGMSIQASGGATPHFSWQTVAGASTYLVTVTSSSAPHLLWTWSGSKASVDYGDTSLDGSTLPVRVWPLPIGGTYRWSVLALSSNGTVVGGKLRAKP